MSVGTLRLAAKQPDHPKCRVCGRFCDISDIAEYIEAEKEICAAKVDASVKQIALENLANSYNELCLSKQPTLCIVCADSSDMDDKGLRLLAIAVINGAYFDLIHGKGINKEAADSFIYGSTQEARNTRTTWHEIAGITPPGDMEVEKRVTNWKLANAC